MFIIVPCRPLHHIQRASLQQNITEQCVLFLVHQSHHTIRQQTQTSYGIPTKLKTNTCNKTTTKTNVFVPERRRCVVLCIPLRLNLKYAQISKRKRQAGTQNCEHGLEFSCLLRSSANVRFLYNRVLPK